MTVFNKYLKRICQRDLEKRNRKIPNAFQLRNNFKKFR